MRTALFNEILHNSGSVDTNTTRLTTMLGEQRHAWGNTKNEEAVRELEFLLDFLLSSKTDVQLDSETIVITNLDGTSITVYDVDVDNNRAFVSSPDINGEVYIEVIGNLLSLSYAGEVFGIFPIDISALGGNHV